MFQQADLFREIVVIQNTNVTKKYYLATNSKISDCQVK